MEMEYEVLTEAAEEPTIEEPAEEVLSDEDRAALVHRPPVVTIMGHVDHGKTSLLDAIRQTKFLLTDAEAGGITQHIGAYHVEVPHEDGTLRQIVFLDTPGHEAFTAMRARGAKVTDIAILVVAADDGVMPQTIEAIDHAKAAGVPIIVAVNKVDKQGADPDRVLTQLMEHGLVPEDFGGETVTVKVSAKKRQNLDLLLEMILLVAEMQDLRANPDRPAEGVIIEAELSRGKGAVATALVENGTLREGDFIVAGSKSGRVRALFDDRGQRVKAAGPSMPVEVLGLDEVPQAGDRFEVVEDGQAVKTLVEQRKITEIERRGYHVTLESLHDMLSKGDIKELAVIIKADVQGTAEAIAESVKKLSALEVAVRVLRTASGDISENDVNLAASSNAIIIGFKTQPDQNAARVAEIAGVDIRTYDVIYQITDDLLKAMQGLIEPLRQEVQIGTAEVRQVFKVGKNLMIAGCMVTSGKVQRGGLARIERDGQIIYEGKIETLKRFKDDAREVAQGFECGMSFEKFNELVEGDKINVFVVQESKRDLTRA
jgi:translation initiation factor IF-2